MFHLIGIGVIGFAAGLIARILAPSRDNPQGLLMTLVVGLLGAIVANFLGEALRIYPPGHSAGFIGATIGAVIVLMIWHQIGPRYRRSP